MTRLAPAVLALLLFVGCSRSGHHPEPKAPLQPKSEYDVLAAWLKVYKDEADATTYSPVPRPQRTLSVADSTSAWVGHTIQNVGLATLPRGSLYFSVTINDKLLIKDTAYGNSRPITPGEFESGSVPVNNLWAPFRFNKPGRYEVRLRAWLPERFGETNLDDNELIHYVDVEE